MLVGVAVNQIDIQRGLRVDLPAEPNRPRHRLGKLVVVLDEEHGPRAAQHELLQTLPAECAVLVGIVREQRRIADPDGGPDQPVLGGELEPGAVASHVEPDATAHDQVSAAAHVPRQPYPRLQVVHVGAAVGTDEVVNAGVGRIGGNVGVHVVEADVRVDVVANAEVHLYVLGRLPVVLQVEPDLVRLVVVEAGRLLDESEGVRGRIGRIERIVGIEVPLPALVEVGLELVRRDRKVAADLEVVVLLVHVQRLIHREPLAREELRQGEVLSRRDRRTIDARIEAVRRGLDIVVQVVKPQCVDGVGRENPVVFHDQAVRSGVIVHELRSRTGGVRPLAVVVVEGVSNEERVVLIEAVIQLRES